MKIERVNDSAATAAIFATPGIREIVWYDGIPKVIPAGERIYHLLVREEQWADGAVHDETIGAVVFVPMNMVTWNPHMGILVPHRGKGTEALKLALEWLFKNTPALKVVACPPETNGAMIRVFEKCGFTLEGYSPSSHQDATGDRLWGRQMYGLSKPAILAT